MKNLKMLFIVLVVSCLALSPVMAWGKLPGETIQNSSQTLSAPSLPVLETTEKVVETTSKTPSQSSVVTLTKDDYDAIIAEANLALNDSKKSSSLYEDTINTLTTAYTGLSADYDKIAKELRTFKPYLGFNVNYAFDKDFSVGFNLGAVVKNNLLISVGFNKNNMLDWKKLDDIKGYSLSFNLGWIF